MKNVLSHRVPLDLSEGVANYFKKGLPTIRHLQELDIGSMMGIVLVEFSEGSIVSITRVKTDEGQTQPRPRTTESATGTGSARARNCGARAIAATEGTRDGVIQSRTSPVSNPETGTGGIEAATLGKATAAVREVCPGGGGGVCCCAGGNDAGECGDGGSDRMGWLQTVFWLR